MTEKFVALSFDDGPNACDVSNSPEADGCNTMNDMLDVLEKHGVAASFFLIGNKICEQNKKVILRALSLGCDIENHSWSHPNMPEKDLSEAQIFDEFLRADDAIFDVTGKRPQFFRPPYLSVNQAMYRTIPLPFIAGHPCDDWLEEASVEDRLSKMLSGAQDGTIFLLHVDDGNFKTVEVVDRAIPILKARGFSLATVPELFCIKGVVPTRGKMWTVVGDRG